MDEDWSLVADFTSHIVHIKPTPGFRSVGLSEPFTSHIVHIKLITSLNTLTILKNFTSHLVHIKPAEAERKSIKLQSLYIPHSSYKTAALASAILGIIVFTSHIVHIKQVKVIGNSVVYEETFTSHIVHIKQTIRQD